MKAFLLRCFVWLLVATPAFALTELNGVAALSVGAHHNCAIASGGSLFCWGWNGAGQVGDGTTANRLVATPVSGLSSGVLGVATSRGPLSNASGPEVAVAHTCAIVQLGGVRCWGANESGQLGDGGNTPSATPVQVQALPTAIIAVAAGARHSCAVTGGGAALCWGANDQGQLGDGTTTPHSTPVPVSGLGSGVAAIAAGFDHTCALTETGAVKCWGSNDAGQLGDGTTVQRWTPVDVVSLSSGVTRIAAGGLPYGFLLAPVGTSPVGGGYTCAIASGDAAKCWGANYSNQLGDGTNTNQTNRLTPFEVTGLTAGTIDIAPGVGWRHVSYFTGGLFTSSCAVAAGGVVECWGGSYADPGTPTSVGLPGTFASVGVGTFHRCALGSDGRVSCWGGNNFGQLGNGTTTGQSSASPAIVQSGLLAQTITFGPAPVMVVGETKTVTATGGASGNPVVFSSLTPSICTVSGSNVTGVAAGQCIVAANQAGNAEYDPAAQATLQFEIGAAYNQAQTITFQPLATLAVGGTQPLVATASSGLAVTFISNTPSVCSVSGTTVTALAIGTCNVAASQPGNAFWAAAPQTVQSFSVINTPRISGISTRMQVLTGDNVMIAGFIIGGATPKTVVVRARGPSLGVAGAIADPTLTLVPAAGGANTVNDDWGTAANAAQLSATGYAPANAKESAIMATLDPGAYTAIVSGVGDTTGLAIVEVYELAQPDVPLEAISTRGFVQTGDNVMIGGFIISGSGPQTVVIRARGPSLGVAGALADPTLTLVPSSGPAIANDDWGTAGNAATLAASGYAPANPKESAILITLNPGAYTAVVSGVGNTTGVAIVEVYVP